MPEWGTAQERGHTTTGRVCRGSDFYSHNWHSIKWTGEMLLLRSLINPRACWLNYSHVHVLMNTFFTRESNDPKAGPSVNAESPCKHLLWYIPFLNQGPLLLPCSMPALAVQWWTSSHFSKVGCCFSERSWWIWSLAMVYSHPIREARVRDRRWRGELQTFPAPLSGHRPAAACSPSPADMV